MMNRCEPEERRVQVRDGGREEEGRENVEGQKGRETETGGRNSWGEEKSVGGRLR